jgi:membrane-associated protein
MLELIHHFGYIGIFINLFVETAFMAFFLPGDSLLFAAGILANDGVFDLTKLFFVVLLASTLAGHAGYFIGTKIDKEILINNKYFRIKDAHLHKTEKAFEKYGFWAIVFSRFIPFLRNFLSQFLGMINYDKKKFAIANFLSSVLWPAAVIPFGFYFGKMFPNLVIVVEKIIVIILFAFFIPLFHELWKQNRKEKKTH